MLVINTMPEPNMAKIMRGRKGTRFPQTRFRQDIGLADDLEDESTRIIPDGIIIYTTKESDEALHAVLAYAMGYTPASFINIHKPAEKEGYDYIRLVSLVRPTIKHQKWRAANGKIHEPGVMVKRIREQFKDVKRVKIEVAQGVDLF